jgi:hypothetical protein
VAGIIDMKCINLAINGHMLGWLARTDGSAGEFIKANRHPSGGNCFVLTTPGGRKLAGGGGSHGAEAVLQEGLRQWEKLSKEERVVLPLERSFANRKRGVAPRHRAAWSWRRSCAT